MKRTLRTWILLLPTVAGLTVAWDPLRAVQPVAGGGFPQKLGDFDGDGRATVLDLVRLIEHLNGTAPLSSELLLFADVTGNGAVDEGDADIIALAILGTASLPDLPDSDGDGLPDAWETMLGLDPHNPDTNGNGILDGAEDSDGDGLKNWWEARYGYDPRNPSTRKTLKPGGGYVLDGEEDPDFDRLTNLQEQTFGTNPLLADTDGDGWSDEAELTGHGDPLDPRVGPQLFVSAAPRVSALASGPGGFQYAALGTVMALPPTKVLVSGPGELSQITLGMIISYPPVTALVSGVGQLEGFGLGPTVAHPPLTMLVSGVGAVDSVGLGTIVARPPVTALAPGVAASDLGNPGIVVAQPPLSVLSSGLNPLSAVSLGVVLAQPPVTLLAPGLGLNDTEAALGTFSALPPVNIRINPETGN